MKKYSILEILTLGDLDLITYTLDELPLSIGTKFTLKTLRQWLKGISGKTNILPSFCFQGSFLF